MMDSRYEKKQVMPIQEKISIDELLTLEEMTNLFKRTRQTIGNWVKKGHFKVLVIEDCNYYNKREVESFLNKKFKGFTIDTHKKRNKKHESKK